jgi:hypothetical protein
VRYTVWSRGRLLGETDLGFVYRENEFRCGWFHPTAKGEQLMPIATGFAFAVRNAWLMGLDPSVRADLASAEDEEQALGLQLRGPNGALIPTRSITIVDFQNLSSIPREDSEADGPLDPEQEAEIEALIEEWENDPDVREARLLGQTGTETEWPRYQLQVFLVDDRSVP